MIVKEFLPNPAGKDADGEWIKLLNNAGSAIDLSGWKLKDAAGKEFIFPFSDGRAFLIPAGETLSMDYGVTKISLNNNGETIFLYDKNEALIDKAEYSGSAGEGKVYARAENGKFVAVEGLNAPEKAAPISATPNNNQLASVGMVAGGQNYFLNFSIGVFIALVLAAFFVFISKKLELFSAEK